MNRLKKYQLGAISAIALLSVGSVYAQDAATIDYLNMRTGPGVSYPVVKVLPRNSIVHIDKCTNSWCKVYYGPLWGWTSKNHLNFASNNDYRVFYKIDEEETPRNIIVYDDPIFSFHHNHSHWAPYNHDRFPPPPMPLPPRPMPPAPPPPMPLPPHPMPPAPPPPMPPHELPPAPPRDPHPPAPPHMAPADNRTGIGLIPNTDPL